ncbi:hypothetical protein GF351_01815 [Candidatus Woesearchaeota archaeon]|nr:hypothetical protein [Candidatus Woesearchaeota archaeon]
MMGKTHMAFGLFLGLLCLPLLQPRNSLLFLSLAVFAALIPDIDSPDSKLGRKVVPLSHIFKFVFGHRGFFHSIFFPVLMFAGVLGIAFYSQAGYVYAYAVLIGALSHIFIDAITIEGVNLLSPVSRFRVAGFIKTNSLMELAVFVFLTVSCVVILVGVWFS